MVHKIIVIKSPN